VPADSQRWREALGRGADCAVAPSAATITETSVQSPLAGKPVPIASHELSARENAGEHVAAGVRESANQFSAHRRRRRRLKSPPRVRVIVVVSMAIIVGAVIGIIGDDITAPGIPPQGTTTPAIGMPLTTAPAVTTPEPVLLVSTGIGVPLGIGIGVGTTVPGAGVAGVKTGAGVTTVPGVVVTGLLYTGPDIRFRSRLNSPKRRVGAVPVMVITVGVVGAITVPDTTGAGEVVVTGGSAAREFTANRQATTTAKNNRFTMLPPETSSPLTPDRPFGRGQSGVHSVATELMSGNRLMHGSCWRFRHPVIGTTVAHLNCEGRARPGKTRSSATKDGQCNGHRRPFHRASGSSGSRGA
jgi:hypothetical protein